MRPPLIGHLDADAFYVAAERVRDSFLLGKPVGVLGNQGACVIAKSYEMKAAGVKTGEPIWIEAAGGQISGPATVVGDVLYLSTFSGNSTVGFDIGSGRRVFSFDDGEYGPVVSDGEKLYLTGGSTVIAFDPIDLGGYKYKAKPGQKGVVPPAEHRKANAAIRNQEAKDDAKAEAEETEATEEPNVRYRANVLADSDEEDDETTSSSSESSTTSTSATETSSSTSSPAETTTGTASSTTSSSSSTSESTSATAILHNRTTSASS